MQNIPVYVVSLKGAHERRALICEHLQSIGIEYKFFDAVRGRDLDESYVAKVNPSKNLSPGALGCYLSHISIYHHMVTSGTIVALILEDDTVLHHSVKSLLTCGCQNTNFDYCFLGCDDNGDKGFVFYDESRSIDLNAQHKAFYLSSGPYCTNAYLITLEGAKKRVSCAFPAVAPIDHYLSLPYAPRFIAIIPMLAFVNEQSAVGSMSSVGWSAIQSLARRYWLYYPLRNLVKFSLIKKLLFKRRVFFSFSGQWKMFPSAFRVVSKRRYMKK